MDRRAVEKAESRLRVAKRAAADLRSCENYTAFVDTWYTFLVAAKNVWTVLEQGAKDTPQCRQWFGAKAGERRNDELLQYLFEARNDDEHGLEPITEHVPARISIGVKKPGYSNNVYIERLFVDENGEIAELRGSALDGEPRLVDHTPAHAKLVPVRGRGRSPIAVPTTHQGMPLGDTTVAAIADAALIYLGALVSEASRRI